MYFKGMILSGTTEPDVTTLKSLISFIKFTRIFRKQTYFHKFLNSVFYKNYNRPLKNTSTDFDWLSSNPDEVNKYIRDPLCGFHLSLGFFKNLAQGSLQMLKTEKHLRFRKNFSTLIISGKVDPVGNFGKDPMQVEKKYINQGFYRTKLILLEGRHELLNETPDIRLRTYQTIESFFEDKLMGNFWNFALLNHHTKILLKGLKLCSGSFRKYYFRVSKTRPRCFYIKSYKNNKLVYN